MDEGRIDEKRAVCMIDPRTLDTLLHPQFDAEALKKAEPMARALAASPGAASGQDRLQPPRTPRPGPPGARKSSWSALETSPEDIEGMKASQGILTVRGGMTSHAAVVARGNGHLLRVRLQGHRHG